MNPNYPLDHPVAFAHRGARANAPENTLEAFELALKLGANGLESDAWVTADGIAVLDHDGMVRSGLRKRAIGQLNRAELPSHIPTLAELYETCGAHYELSIDVKDAAAFDAVLEVAESYQASCSEPVLSHLWLCHPDLDTLLGWRERSSQVRLVLSTRKADMPVGPERCAADMAAGGIDAVNLHHSEWSLGLTTLFHRFELATFGWDAQYLRVINNLLKMQIDGIYSDHVDLLVDGYTERFGSPPQLR